MIPATPTIHNTQYCVEQHSGVGPAKEIAVCMHSDGNKNNGITEDDAKE
jgi:hypothetical protein